MASPFLALFLGLFPTLRTLDELKDVATVLIFMVEVVVGNTADEVAVGTVVVVVVVLAGTDVMVTWGSRLVHSLYSLVAHQIV